MRTKSGYLGGVAGAIPSITLHFDDVASFMIEGTDVPVGTATTCPRYFRVSVELPGWRTPTVFPLHLNACSRLQVHPIVAGPTGSTPPS